MNRTPFIIQVRPGNRREYTFPDLTRPGCASSHGRANRGPPTGIVAEYGAVRRTGSDPDAGRPCCFSGETWRSGRQRQGGQDPFDSGFGDALITYEQDAMEPLPRLVTL